MKATRKNRFHRKKALTPAIVLRRAGVALKTLGGALMLFSLSAAFIFAHDYFTQSDHFVVKQIVVNGHQRLRRQEVLARAGIGSDTNILALNLTRARKRLLAEPWIAEAAISREIPSGLRIDVREEQPLAIMETGTGALYLVNTQGRVFKRPDESERDAWPRITGLDDGDLPAAGRPDTRGMQAAMALLRLTREAGSPLPYATIRAIDMDRETGATVVLKDTQRTVRLGFGRYREKCEALGQLTTHMRTDNRLADCRMVDLYDINRIVVTPAPAVASEPDQEEVNVAGT